MLKKFWLRLFLALFFGTTLVPLAYSEARFDYGFSLRLRQEYLGDVTDLTEGNNRNNNYFRAKVSLWGKWDFLKNNQLSLFAKLTSEPRYYLTNKNGGAYEKHTRDEIFFDNLYLDAKNVLGLPVDLRIGRQDFSGVYGEGFLIMDGTPVDGSRSYYFNAAKAIWKINDNNSLDLVYINDPHTDEFLPVIDKLGPPEQQLTSSDEDGLILYGRSKVNDQFSLEPYYVRKTEAAIKTPTAIPSLAINAVGLRVVYKLNSWNLRGEFAHEFGEYKGGRNREANGGYLFFTRQFKDTRLSPELNAGFVYLSGDDPDSKEINEGWDPLFSRASFLSDLYSYTYTAEPGAVYAYWTNIRVYRAGMKVALNPKISLSLYCNYMLANESLTPASIFSDGKERGKLYQGTLSCTFTKNIDGFLMAEYFVPGDFYAKTADPAVFVRWQLQFKF